MNIRSPNFIACPKCKAKYDVSGFKNGKKFKCPGCDGTLTVPAAPEPAPSARSVGLRPGTRHGPLARSTARVRPAQAAPAEPDDAPRAQGRRYAPPQSSSLPLIVSAVAVVVVIVVAVAFLKGSGDQGNQQQNQQTSSTGTSQPSGTQTSTATQPSVAAAGTPGTTTTGADATTTPPTGTEPTSQPDTQPGQPTTEPGTAPPGGETPKLPSKKKRGEFIVDHSIKGDIDKLLEEMPDSSEEKIGEYSKVIEAYGDRAIPILIEALKHENTMVANQASSLLRNITGYESLELKPGIDPEDALVIYEQWKEWWCVHQFTYKRRKAERIEKMTQEKFQAEVKRYLGTYRHGTFAERASAERKLRTLGNRVIPVLIDLLCGEDTDMSTPSRTLLQKFTRQTIGDSGQDMGEMSNEERDVIKKKWEDWWEQNRDTFKMPE
jgi:hypothetical protein